MKIKRLEIVGFKSFVDKVSLDFQQGVSGIVGPNGCGKSNIVDAIRWVMGEQSAKNLRGRSMEDVIFGGSESRKPLGMAEVSIVFSNEEGRGPVAFRDYAEIMVTRRLFRDGESDYLINKTPCRLLDITELFMDTGVGTRAYSIIEQGKIGMILNAKPEDRRFLIEEAAGVTKFKSRKKTALRKIEATQQNLLRLGDIVSEVRRQLGGLKRQAQKAQRFRDLREEMRGIELSLAYTRHQSLRGDEERCQIAEGEQAHLVETLGADLAQGELALEEVRLLQVVAEKELAAGQERLFHFSSEIQRAEGRIEYAARELERLERERERLAGEGAEVAQRLAEIDGEEVAMQASGVLLGNDLQQALARLSEGEGALDSLGAAERDTSSRLEEARARLFALLSELSRLGNLQQDADRRLQQQQERVARNRQDAVALREQYEAAQQQLAECTVNLRGVQERREVLQQERVGGEEQVRLLRRELDDNEQALLVAREELNRQASRLQSLQELEQSLDGYGSGVRTVLQTSELGGRFGGMLADAIEVPDRFEVALEAVCGERLQALLAAGREEVRAALDLLLAEGGRCTFLLPISTLPDVGTVPGGIPLAEQVRSRADAATAVAALLQGVWVVESLDPFLSGTALPVGVLLVTPQGETLSWRGELNGGAGEGLAHGLLHKKREIKELSAGVEGRRMQVESLQQRRLQLRDDLQQAETTLVELGAALHRKDLKLVDFQKDHTRLAQEVQRLQERIEILSFEEDQLHEEQQSLQRLFGEAESGRAAKDSEKAVADATVQRFQEELRQQRAELDTVRERVTILKVEAASLREREEGSRRNLERLGKLRAELQGRRVLLEGRSVDAVEEQERLAGERDRLRMELEALFNAREEEKKRFELLRERFESGAQRVSEQEEFLKGRRARLSEARQRQGELVLQLRELQLACEHLRQNLLERYRIDLLDLPHEISIAEHDANIAKARLETLRRSIEEIGEVNLTAVEEYRELDERFQFLTRQQEDLRQSLEGLQTAISKINRTTRKRFRETFDLVNAKFQEVFPRLFRGGRAELRLTDEDDLLESGIDIIAQPPGKKLQNVTLLSGGEKALTAVALIFSIFLIKPSPFCLLDEVDAPLDDANIGRFNEMVREMSSISQFVIITHNKRTMEIADTLYGVTMEEPGVSKLVSVRLNEA